jgi:hypothetical protein
VVVSRGGHGHHTVAVMVKRRTRDIDVAVVGGAVVLCYAAVAQGVQGVLELPERVALEVEADEPALAPREAQHLPLVPRAADGARGRWHGLRVVRCVLLVFAMAWA